MTDTTDYVRLALNALRSDRYVMRVFGNDLRHIEAALTRANPAPPSGETAEDRWGGEIAGWVCGEVFEPAAPDDDVSLRFAAGWRPVAWVPPSTSFALPTPADESGAVYPAVCDNCGAVPTSSWYCAKCRKPEPRAAAQEEPEWLTALRKEVTLFAPMKSNFTLTRDELAHLFRLTQPAGDLEDAARALDAIYQDFCAKDNGDVALERYPQGAVDALARAGWAVVPCDLPFAILGDAAQAGVFDTGNPKHGWDYLIARTRIGPDAARRARGEG